IYTGNRLENLMERLAESLRENPLPPMEKEIIVVQNKGMERWINLEIARENSIAANIDFPFPKAFVYNLFQNFFDLPEESVFSPEVMTWKIMKELDPLLEKDHFSTLKNYVKDDPFGLKRYQISEKIALVFDQYIIARPDLINEWDNDENIFYAKFPESKWQKILWNRIAGKAGKEKSLHHADLRKIFLEKLNSKDFISDLNLPKRVSLFGISTLSPFYVEIFSKLSQFMEVNIYYLNPCREFWEYSFSAREILRFSEQGMDDEDQYYDQGNELLASMGTAGREFFSLLLNSAGDVGEELFFDPGTSTMLDTVQSDILNLVNRKDDLTMVFDERDTTVQIHSCHGPIREIEILYDNLLAVFEENQEITPRDIVVMMPDVTSYAPLIQAVFDARLDRGKKIPFSIADTFIKSNNAVANGFMSILLLGKNRYKASDILDVLEREPVRNRFNITLDNLEFIKGWVKDTNTCWGVDGDYKKTLLLPAFHENTWRFGLERMLLGHALPPNEEHELFSGIFPYGEIEGEGAVILGRFTNFVESLFSAVKDLNQDRTLVQWAETMNKILNDFFKLDNKTENDLNEIRGIFTENGLSGIAEAVDFQQEVSFEIIKSFLEKHIDSSHGDRGFITTGVTFCTLLPMRSIPFKVVYLVGMNDGEYPGTFQRPGFDLIDKKR
ncbi:MAG: exodeoxyribonuclease V subunit gamma, partial [Thermodesulfobacteriota bacterium]|nr:exodeoxyribonuclease V subunit gamma [Thermodesulfobacteriota bacterium]